MIGIGLNFADLLYYPCGKGLFLTVFLCNQIFLITYYHPLFHIPMYFIKKLVMLKVFENIRKKVKRCIDKQWNKCRIALSCNR